MAGCYCEHCARTPRFYNIRTKYYILKKTLHCVFNLIINTSATARPHYSCTDSPS